MKKIFDVGDLVVFNQLLDELGIFIERTGIVLKITHQKTGYLHNSKQYFTYKILTPEGIINVSGTNIGPDFVKQTTLK